MNNLFKRFVQWLIEYWLGVVVILTLLWSFVLLIVAMSWLIGYYANALKGFKFDLGSCWTGVSVVAGAFVSIIGLAKAGWTRSDQKLEEYKIDSVNNSEAGQMPYEEEVIK